MAASAEMQRRKATAAARAAVVNEVATADPMLSLAQIADRVSALSGLRISHETVRHHVAGNAAWEAARPARERIYGRRRATARMRMADDRLSNDPTEAEIAAAEVRQAAIREAKFQRGEGHVGAVEIRVCRVRGLS